MFTLPKRLARPGSNESNATGWGHGAPDHPRLPRHARLCAVLPGLCLTLSLHYQPDLIAPRGSAEIDWRRVLLFLQRRQDLLDAVVFSGGEPTLQEGLPAAMDEVRAMGFRVGLHSAGMKPAGFANALRHADWVGFDVKALVEDYQLVTQVKGSGAASGAVWRPCWPVAWTTVPHHGALASD